MTQKLFCLCAAFALLFAFATVNVASAEETSTAAGCPCGYATALPCKCVTCAKLAGPCKFDPCHPPVTYRVGLFGVVRPVVYAPPVYRPGFYPYRYSTPYRPVLAW